MTFAPMDDDEGPFASAYDPYVQCLLRNGNRSQVSWLSEKYAVIGETLRLRTKGVWEDGWKVIETYQRVARPPNLQRARRSFERKLK